MCSNATEYTDDTDKLVDEHTKVYLSNKYPFSSCFAHTKKEMKMLHTK